MLRKADALTACGYNFFTGVACSILAPLIEELTELEPAYVPAVREDLAVGVASGAYAAGAKPVVLMQNSGLGYSLNAMTSLNLIYKIPFLLIVGYRGFGGKPNDAPEHWEMGEHCEALLNEIGIKTFVPDADNWAETIEQANVHLETTALPTAVLVRKGILK